MIDSRSVKDLNPIMQVLVEKLLELAAEKGLKVGVSNTLRDVEKQNDLYAQGRTKSGAIVTSVRGGYSYHNWGLAADIVPLNASGNLSWPNSSPVWAQLGELGESLGMEWGGRWVSPVDRPHHQITFGYNCSNFVNGIIVPKSIKLGCKDTRLVKAIQRRLCVTADGVFGQMTQDAAKAYGSTNGDIDAAVLRRILNGKKIEVIKETCKIEVKEIEVKEIEIKEIEIKEIEIKEMEEMRYNTLQEIPTYGQDTIKKLIDKGILNGRGDKLDISDDMVRVLVINDRSGLYDK